MVQQSKQGSKKVKQQLTKGWHSKGYSNRGGRNSIAGAGAMGQ